jgi:hypothetical protein
MDVRGLIAAAAQGQGIEADADRACRALEATAAAFRRRQAGPTPPRLSARRRRLHRLLAALRDVQDELYGLERDEDGLPRKDRHGARLWGGLEALAEWRASLERAAGKAEGLLAGLVARPGPPRDASTRALVLEVAWTLHREGLTVSAYPEGLLAEVARAVAFQAGRRLPEGEAIRRLLRPAVALCRGRGYRVRASEASILDLTDDPAPGAPYRQTH